ncbi:hypothetical protein Y032_0777g2274 [Ancylostoma ceylanicum]|uniref:Uncharacterized protein n=1 Tax=Ancylostoma ceylanicum TaxID=53326 RepID=A0A016WDD0_9BILA|nr:hypothetical protein Y032_0777g2274 [Ancylostoma ceylanicum]
MNVLSFRCRCAQTCATRSSKLLKYDYRKRFFWNYCDQRLPNKRTVCENSGCLLQGVNPKRTKNLRRKAIHNIKIRAQLEVILKSSPKKFVGNHRDIHWVGA